MSARGRGARSQATSSACAGSAPSAAATRAAAARAATGAARRGGGGAKRGVSAGRALAAGTADKRSKKVPVARARVGDERVCDVCGDGSKDPVKGGKVLNNKCYNRTIYMFLIS